MPIDRFTKDQFEAALPKHVDTGELLWECLGIEYGEYTYAVPVVRKDEDHIRIVIRSSVDEYEVAAETGEDSIRLWLEGGNELGHSQGGGMVAYLGISWQPLGKPSQRWITRQRGWERRLGEKLRELYAAGLKVQRCSHCKDWKVIRTVKKDSVNKGRLFAVCRHCEIANADSQFQWLTPVNPKMQEKYGAAK